MVTISRETVLYYKFAFFTQTVAYCKSKTPLLLSWLVYITSNPLKELNSNGPKILMAFHLHLSDSDVATV